MLGTAGLLAAWAAAVVIAVLVGRARGRVIEGVILGVVFTWLGVLIVALLPKTRERKLAEEIERQDLAEQAALLRDRPDVRPPR